MLRADLPRATRSRGRGKIPVVYGLTRSGRPGRPRDRKRWSAAGEESVVAAPRSPAPVLAALFESVTQRAEGETTWHVGEVSLGKRVLDVTLILLAMPLLLPVFCLVALYIKVVSRGPVFYTQERVGYRGHRFRMYKFRSMRLNAEASLHHEHTTHLFRSNRPMEKLDHVDPRLIPFAWLMRSTGLDELPQLINVLRGEMSLVGPRPCTIYVHEVMQTWHKRRFSVLPGITGLWQVNGKNQTTFLEMMNYDVEYARRWSFWLDLKIMFATVPALVGQVKEILGKRRQARIRDRGDAVALVAKED